MDGIRDDALYFRDLSNVDRVEVIKGPAAVLYGRGSSGGLINRVTKKPWYRAADFSFSYGSGPTSGPNVDVGRPATARGVPPDRRAGAMPTATASQQFLRRSAIAPSLELRLGPQTTVLLQADYLEDKRLTDFGIRRTGAARSNVPALHLLRRGQARDVDTRSRAVLGHGHDQPSLQ